MYITDMSLANSLLVLPSPLNVVELVKIIIIYFAASLCVENCRNKLSFIAPQPGTMSSNTIFFKGA